MELPTKLHRQLEKKYGCEKNSLKGAVAKLQEKYKYSVKEVEEFATGCDLYCKKHGNNFAVAFNLAVSSLSHPKNAQYRNN